LTSDCLLREFGQKARKTVVREFSRSVIEPRLLRVLEELPRGEIHTSEYGGTE
jgi:hypothetical protein